MCPCHHILMVLGWGEAAQSSRSEWQMFQTSTAWGRCKHHRFHPSALQELRFLEGQQKHWAEPSSRRLRSPLRGHRVYMTATSRECSWCLRAVCLVKCSLCSALGWREVLPQCCVGQWGGEAVGAEVQDLVSCVEILHSSLRSSIPNVGAY